MVFFVLFMQLRKLVETTVVKDRGATGPWPACPLQRLAHQLFNLIQMNNTEETMSRLTTDHLRSTAEVSGRGISVIPW